MNFHLATISQAAPEDPSILGSMPGFVLLDPRIQPSLNFQIRAELAIERSDEKTLQRGFPSLIRRKNKIQPFLKIQAAILQFPESQDVTVQKDHRNLTSRPESA